MGPLGSVLGLLGCTLESLRASWKLLGASWAVLGVSWHVLEAPSRPSRVILDSFGAVGSRGARWGCLGDVLGPFGAVSRRPGAVLGLSRGLLGLSLRRFG